LSLDEDRTSGGLPPKGAIAAVGVDIVGVDEVREALSRFGDRYLRRVFTDHEIASSTRQGEVKASELAARFAAKEAAIKALRPCDRAPAWRSIEVRRHDAGTCTLQLTGHAADLAGRARLCGLTLSLAQAGDQVVAVVFALEPSGLT